MSIKGDAVVELDDRSKGTSSGLVSLSDAQIISSLVRLLTSHWFADTLKKLARPTGSHSEIETFGAKTS